jgi:hypothetical protein
LARLTQAVGVNVFRHNTTSVGLNPPGWNHMKQAMQFVLPYMQKKEKFPMPYVKPWCFARCRFQIFRARFIELNF